jgi:hypothetical protein
MLRTKANIIFYNINHVAILMCNSLKCWFKHPLPYMILEVSWDNLWALSLGLSQYHGHGSWLVCEVALRRVIAYGTCACLLKCGILFVDATCR